MRITDTTYILFAGFNALRVVSYVPQIHGVIRDNNGAWAISYSTWGFWPAAMPRWRFTPLSRFTTRHRLRSAC